jgi:hypothetical protein
VLFCFSSDSERSDFGINGNKEKSMLKFASIVSAVALTASVSTAAVLYQSPLTAPPLAAGNLVGQDGWVNHSGSANFIQVGSTGATIAHGSGSREDASVGITPISAGQTYYFGFDVVVTGSSESVYFAHFKDIGTDFTTRVFVAPATDGSDFTFGVSPAGSSASSTFATGFGFGTTNRVIGSYDADTREVKLWVNATAMGDASLSHIDPAPAAITAFALRQGGVNNTQVVSNLVVATSFGEVVPEPATLGLLAGAGILALRRRA